MEGRLRCSQTSMIPYFDSYQKFHAWLYYHPDSSDSPVQNIGDIRNCRRTKVPIFDLETGARSDFKELEVSEDCGVVSIKLIVDWLSKLLPWIYMLSYPLSFKGVGWLHSLSWHIYEGRSLLGALGCLSRRPELIEGWWSLPETKSF